MMSGLYHRDNEDINPIHSSIIHHPYVKPVIRADHNPDPHHPMGGTMTQDSNTTIQDHGSYGNRHRVSLSSHHCLRDDHGGVVLQPYESGLATPLVCSSETRTREKSASPLPVDVITPHGGKLFEMQRRDGLQTENRAKTTAGDDSNGKFMIAMHTIDRNQQDQDHSISDIGTSLSVDSSVQRGAAFPLTTELHPYHAKRTSPSHEEVSKKRPDGTNTEDDKVDTGPPYTCAIGHWRCSYCGVTSTECRRRGPPGYDKLCNRCGARWSRGRGFISEFAEMLEWYDSMLQSQT